MVRILSIIGIALALSGCNPFSSDKIDTSFTKAPCEECPTCPDEVICPTESEILNGYITDIADDIDVNDVRLNHYVDEVMLDSNMGDVIDINGSLAVKNAIQLVPYEGTPIKHTLIIEFYQIR